MQVIQIFLGILFLAILLSTVWWIIIYVQNKNLNKWANIPGVIIKNVESISNNSQIKIYDGGPMGDQDDLQTSKDIATAMEKLNFTTYCPARDGFALIDALKLITDDKSITEAQQLEKKYYLYAGISSIDFYQLLLECQVAFFDVRPYWGDNCINNPDNGTVVELAVASTCNKHRTFYKDCNVKKLANCMKTTTDCMIPNRSEEQSCKDLAQKVGFKNFYRGSCTRELGGNNQYSGWDNPMILAASMNNAFQTGNDTYSYNDLSKALQHITNDVLNYKLVTYKIYDHGTKKIISHKALDSQMPFVLYPKWLQNQILLGYHLNNSQNSLKSKSMMEKINGFVDLVKNMGVKYYGIEAWNKFTCPTKPPP